METPSRLKRKCGELLAEGEIVKVKLDSMIKGAKAEKAATNALLSAITAKD